MLYRQCLQVERDLRAGAMAGQAIVGAETPGVARPGVAEAVHELGRFVRTTAHTVIDVASDERTGWVITRMAGPQWPMAARIAAVGALAARSVARARGRRREEPTG